MKNFLFFIGLDTLLTHELNAIFHHEWRVHQLIRALPDEIGILVFVALHIPILAGLMALGASYQHTDPCPVSVRISVFLVFHGLLHFLFIGHPGYEFSSLLSEILIFGGAVLGAIYLALEGKGRYARAA